MSVDEVCEVIITAPDEDWLAQFTDQLVERRLAACGHLLPAIRSTYRWDGQVHRETESRVALHTRADLLPRIIAETQAKHPYQVPCVIALPIRDGNPDYLQWIRDETTTPTP